MELYISLLNRKIFLYVSLRLHVVSLGPVYVLVIAIRRYCAPAGDTPLVSSNRDKRTTLPAKYRATGIITRGTAVTAYGAGKVYRVITTFHALRLLISQQRLDRIDKETMVRVRRRRSGKPTHKTWRYFPSARVGSA